MRFYRYNVSSDTFNAVGPYQWERRPIQIYKDRDRLIPTWKKWPISLIEESSGITPDFPALSGHTFLPICSQRAWDILEPYIGDSCEALPVELSNGLPYYIIHLLDEIDCLDKKRSDLDEIDGCVVFVARFAFKKDTVPIIEKRYIFRTPVMSGPNLLMTDNFRKLVEDNNLTGINFRPIKMVK